MLLHPVLNQIRNDVIVRKLNRTSITVGSPRSGKSWASARILELTSSAFDVNNVVWTIPQFMGLTNSNKLKDGSGLMFDEAGVSMNARNWYERENKNAMMTLQTYGYRHFNVLFTTPSMSYVDSQSRKLFNYLFEPIEMNKRAGTVTVSVKEMSHNPQTDKIYYKTPVINGRRYPYIILSKPSEEFVKSYESLSEKWKTILSKQIETDIKANNSKSMSVEDIVNAVKKDFDGFTKVTKSGEKKIETWRIKNFFGVSDRKALEARNILAGGTHTRP